MSDNKPLEDPTGRAVAVFDTMPQAESAYQELVSAGIASDQIRLLNGISDARQVDGAPKWFADTDEEIRVYKRKLENGKTVLTVPVENHKALKKIQNIFLKSGATMMTHFGHLVTVSQKLNPYSE